MHELIVPAVLAAQGSLALRRISRSRPLPLAVVDMDTLTFQPDEDHHFMVAPVVGAIAVRLGAKDYQPLHVNGALAFDVDTNQSVLVATMSRAEYLGATLRQGMDVLNARRLQRQDATKKRLSAQFEGVQKFLATRDRMEWMTSILGQ